MATKRNNINNNNNMESSTEEYYYYLPLGKAEEEGSIGGGGGGVMFSPVPFRDEAGVHNDASERITFQGDNLTLPSSRGDLFADHDDEDEDDDLHNYSPLLRSSSTRRRLFHGAYNAQRPGLNGLNYLNLVTYAAHLFVSWGIGVWGLDGILETRWQITTEFETLLTPAKWSYYLWAPILIWEGFFAIAQLIPHYAARPIIQAGTGFFFFYTFLLQTAWTLFYSFELFIFSFLSVVAALISLLSLLESQHRSLLSRSTSNSSSSSRLEEYWLFRFPFYLHAGWMMLMTVDHLCLLFRKYCIDSIGLQVAIDIVSLGILMSAVIVPLLQWNDFIIPSVIVWSYVGIASRLNHPSALMIDLYGFTIIQAIRMASIFFAGGAACFALLPAVVVWLTREYCTIQVVEVD